MSATTRAIPTDKYGVGPVPDLQVIPVAEGQKILAGTIVCLGGGNAVSGFTSLDLIPVGRANADADNTDGEDGDITVEVERGVFQWKNSTGDDEITQQEVGRPCFIVDNQTVAKTSGDGTRSAAGRVFSVDSLGVYVEIGQTETASFTGLIHGVVDVDRNGVSTAGAVPAATVVRGTEVLRKAFSAPGAGAKDVTIFAADGLPSRLRVMDVTVLISTGGGAGVTARLYDQAAGAGNALSSVLDISATGKVPNDDTATRLTSEPDTTIGMFLRLSDGTSAVGEVLVTVAPESD